MGCDTMKASRFFFGQAIGPTTDTVFTLSPEGFCTTSGCAGQQLLEYACKTACNSRSEEWFELTEVGASGTPTIIDKRLDTAGDFRHHCYHLAAAIKLHKFDTAHLLGNRANTACFVKHTEDRSTCQKYRIKLRRRIMWFL